MFLKVILTFTCYGGSLSESMLTLRTVSFSNYTKNIYTGAFFIRTQDYKL